MEGLPGAPPLSRRPSSKRNGSRHLYWGSARNRGLSWWGLRLNGVNISAKKLTDALGVSVEKLMGDE
jgi:hypothetical protein